MAKTDKDSLQKLSALMAKAVQRGEKLERTLTKLVAQSEPGSATEDLLKAVQGGLKAIRKNVKSMERSVSADAKKASKEKAQKSDRNPEKHKATPKKPASADITPLAEVNGRE
ncbi:hypothetical protein DC522_23090 [Microvirga sp. KLBC 81]|uniref:hypothetical protein n=1 Tax=Microvirga sp. KLBC 81 TaxID=1862707 RepID=UPI000D5244E4|nr:hypothetical protein [Microvirga sp. KLBC 81]PVE22049.1 hypothetical protein DC522_23090 [Microvirga sp. KLBC 81]